jgi:diguanylate cyclase
VPIPPDSTFLDAASGLSNRRHFDVLYDFAFNLAARGVSLSLVHLELGGFDGLRARQGDEAADAALQSFGQILKESTRTMDLAARLDGARFTTMLMDCNLHGSLVYADRIRDAASDFSVSSGLAVCAGVATFVPGMESAAQLLALADATMAVAVDAKGQRVGVPADLEEPGSVGIS